MTVWSDYAGYARLGVSMFGVLAYLIHTPPFHWLIGSIFAGLHVVMTALRVVLAVVWIMKMPFATLGNAFASLGSGRSALLAAALPALKPRFRRHESKEPESVGRAIPLGLALLAGIGSLVAANLEAAAGLAHFAVAIASVPVICAAAWALRQLAEERAD